MMLSEAQALSYTRIRKSQPCQWGQHKAGSNLSVRLAAGRQAGTEQAGLQKTVESLEVQSDTSRSNYLSDAPTVSRSGLLTAENFYCLKKRWC